MDYGHTSQSGNGDAKPQPILTREQAFFSPGTGEFPEAENANPENSLALENGFDRKDPLGTPKSQETPEFPETPSFSEAPKPILEVPTNGEAKLGEVVDLEPSTSKPNESDAPNLDNIISFEEKRDLITKKKGKFRGNKTIGKIIKLFEKNDNPYELVEEVRGENGLSAIHSQASYGDDAVFWNQKKDNTEEKKAA